MQGTFAHKHDIKDYMCVLLDHHPWVPTIPGTHGFVMLGLGIEETLFKHGERKHLFVGLSGEFLYCGFYQLGKTDALSKEEWASLPPSVGEFFSVSRSDRLSCFQGETDTD